MRIISYTIKSIQTELPVLSNIAPPDLRRLCHVTKIFQKLSTFQNLLLQKDILDHPPLRLKHPIWSTDALKKPINSYGKNDGNIQGPVTLTL